MDSDTDADDEVVQELDVYLSKTLSKNLYIFQYPSKPTRDNSIDRDAVVSARVKPGQHKVELDIGLDCDSQNYNYGRGEQIVLNMKGSDDLVKNNNSNVLERQTLTSTKAVSSTSNYAVGLLVKGELHLVPVESVVHLRPSFNYLDAADGAQSKKDSAMEEADVDEPQAVTVKFASQETERSKAAKERSFHFLQKKAASEPWINTTYFPSWSGRASLEHSLLRCSQKEQDSSDIQCSASDYINTLVPLECNGTNKSLTGLVGSKISHSDRIKSIFLNAKVVKFDQLVELLKPIDPAVVLRLLQPVAVLVQGCWVVKSELLYPKDSFSDVTRVPAENLGRARDFIMWKFNDNPLFDRKDIPPTLKFLDEDWKNILTNIATRQSDGRWKFRYDYDNDFVKSYPEAVQRQKMLWAARNQLMSKIAAGTATATSTTTATPTSAATTNPTTPRSEPTSPTSQSKKPRRKSSREDSPQKMVGTKQTGDLKEENLEGGGNSMPDLHKQLTQIMKTHHCLSLTQIKGFLTPANQQRYTDKELEDGIVKVNGVFRLSNKWPQNATEEPIYGLIRVGDSLDKLRESLLDLFSKTARIRFATYQKKVEDELGGKNSAAETYCRKILNEFCVLKSGFYYMKGTIALENETATATK